MAAVSVPFRALRAAVFAAVCAALAACGHAYMSPDVLPLWAPAAGFALVFAAAFAGAGRERSLPAIAGSLIAGQAALHTLYAWASAAATAPEGGMATIVDRLLCGPRDSQGHILLPAGWSPEEIVRNARIDPALLDPPSPHAHGSGPMLFEGGTGMLAAHLFAALLTAWWLRRGEAALFAVVSVVTAPLRVVLAVLCPVIPPGPEDPRGIRPAHADPEPMGHQVPLRHAVVRRGPPEDLALAC